MQVKFLNLHNKNWSFKINNQRVKLRTDIDGHFFISEDLEIGHHSINVSQRTWYDTPLCYFNILNPVFFLWQLKFLEHEIIDFKDFGRNVNISFDIIQRNVNFVLFFNYYDKSKKQINPKIKVHDGIDNISIKVQQCDPIIIKRYKNTHIFSLLFYTIFFYTLGIIDCFQNGRIVENLIFLLIITFFSCKNVCRIMKLNME